MEIPTSCSLCHAEMNHKKCTTMIIGCRVEKLYNCSCKRFSVNCIEDDAASYVVNRVIVRESTSVTYFWFGEAGLFRIRIINGFDIIYEELTTIDSVDDFMKRIAELEKSALFV